MPKPTLLNNIDHKDLRIITKRAAEFGDNVMFATTFPSEFSQLQAHYPIVFNKTQDGLTFEALALFGFQPEENLFLNAEGWDASYVPLSIERQPFLIGIAGETLTIHVHMDSPKISKDQSEGEPVFLPYGSPTPFLERMNSTLLEIHQGLQSMPAFIGMLLELNLLESFIFDIELNDGSQYRLDGFYTINQEKLSALNGEQLAMLHRVGYLQAIYMVTASMWNFRALIDRKNRLHAEIR